MGVASPPAPSINQSNPLKLNIWHQLTLMAKWCSNSKLNWLPGRPDWLSPLVSIVTPSINLIQTFTCREAFDLQHQVHTASSGSTYEGGLCNECTERPRGMQRGAAVFWCWLFLRTPKEAKPWAPEDVQRWRWHSGGRGAPPSDWLLQETPLWLVRQQRPR